MRWTMKGFTAFTCRQWTIIGRLLLTLGLGIGLVGCAGTEFPEATPVVTPGVPTSNVTVVAPTVTPTLPPPTPQPKTATASLQIVPSAPRVGDALDVILKLSDVEELRGVEAHLSFDPSSVTPIDADAERPGIQIEHGGFLSPDFVVQNVISETEGSIHYAVSQMPPQKPVSGVGVLMTVHLKAASPGDLLVAVDSLILANVAEQAIPVTFETREVRLPIE